MRNLSLFYRILPAVAVLAASTGCHMHFHQSSGHQGDVQIEQSGDRVDITAHSDDGRQNSDLTIHADNQGAAKIQGTFHVDGQGDFHIDGVFGQGKVQKEVEQKFASDRVDRLQATAGSGDIVVEPTEGDHDEIQIHAVKIVSGNLSQRDLRPFLDKVTVTAVLQGRTLVVKSQVAPDALPHGVSYTVNYKITVPKRLGADLTSGSGDISVHGVQSGVTVQSGSGDVSLQEISGAIKAHTASGALHLGGVHPAGSMDLETASGDLEVAGATAAGSDLVVNLSTASGAIKYEGDATLLTANSASGDIEIKPTGHLPLGSANVTAVSGGVAFTLPPSSSAHISAHTVSGSLDLPSRDNSGDGDTQDGEERHDATAQVGAGGGAVNLTTTSGDITVHAEH